MILRRRFEGISRANIRFELLAPYEGWASVSARDDSAGKSLSDSAQAELEERTICSHDLKRQHDTLIPLLEHAIAYLHELRVRFHIGAYFL